MPDKRTERDGGFLILEAPVVGSLGIEREAKALLPNSATSTHILMKNSTGY